MKLCGPETACPTEKARNTARRAENSFPKPDVKPCPEFTSASSVRKRRTESRDLSVCIIAGEAKTVSCGRHYLPHDTFRDEGATDLQEAGASRLCSFPSPPPDYCVHHVRAIRDDVLSMNATKGGKISPAPRVMPDSGQHQLVSDWKLFCRNRPLPPYLQFPRRNVCRISWHHTGPCRPGHTDYRSCRPLHRRPARYCP